MPNIKPRTSRHRAKRGAFAAIELLVIVIVLFVLTALLWPALSIAGAKSQAAQCLDNHKQLITAFLAYADNNSGSFSANEDGDHTSLENPAPVVLPWVNGLENYQNGSHGSDTNTQYLLSPVYAALGSFVPNAAIYRCPSDRSCQYGIRGGLPRVRTVSMNQAVGCGLDGTARGAGVWLGGGSDPGNWSIYLNEQSIKNPSPVNLFIFLDENPDTINDGAFDLATSGINNNAATWVDLPAAFHLASVSLSFADGHAGLHRWLDPEWRRHIDAPPAYGNPFGYPGYPGQQSVAGLAQTVDLRWLGEHTSALKAGAPGSPWPWTYVPRPLATLFHQSGRAALRPSHYPQVAFIWLKIFGAFCGRVWQKLGMESSSPVAAAAWAGKELAGVAWSDRRLMKRAHRLMTQFAQQPNASIPQACGPWSQTKAAYRFFDNPAVKPEEILQAHRQATLERMRERKVVLAVQDTTSLHYTHPCTEGLGPIATNADKTLGLLLHTTLALGVEGQPLGVLEARSWARQARRFGSSRQSRIRARQPLAQKESWRWVESLQRCQDLAAACPGVLIVNIADREGDIYEALAQALAGPANVQWLVRMQHNRKLAEEDRQVWDLLARQPALATLEVRTPRRPGQASRLAVLTVRVTPATVRAPSKKEKQPPLPLWAVEAREEKPPRGQPALCWRLVSSAAVETAEAALEKIRWYARRWQIETLHKTLKSGCQVEQRQLETAERLRRVLAFDLIVAWRIMALAWAARSEPEGSCADWLEPEEWKVLWRHFHPQSRAPEKAPTLAQGVKWIAQLGGFLARNSDGPPGPMTLWRGLTRLHHMADLYSRLCNCG